MSVASVFDLSPSEKLQLVEDLWDDLASNPEEVPVQDWHIAEIDARKQRLQAHPDTGLNWDEVKRQIRAKYGR